MQTYKFSKNTSFPCSPTTQCKGFTPIMVDVLNGKINYNHLEKYDINAQNEEGWTALMIACRNSAPSPKGWGLEKLVSALLARGADPNVQNKDGYTALMYASKHSNDTSTEKSVRTLLSYGADPNIETPNKTTALKLVFAYSSSASNIKMIDILLEHGAKGLPKIYLLNFENVFRIFQYKINKH